jgi:hypothetical protein
MVSRVVAWWRCGAPPYRKSTTHGIQLPAGELQAALQKRELKEYGQRIGREVKEAHKKWLKKASSCRLSMAAARYNILSSY